MPPDPLETLRHELPDTLALRSDLADLEARADRLLAAAHDQRDRLAQQRRRVRQDWQEWVISGVGGALAAAGLTTMILFGEISRFDLVVSGGGSILTLWSASRFRRKVLAERHLRRQFDRLAGRVANLDQARRKIRQARRRASARRATGGR